MKAALYARYSTDKQREASIADQYRNCEKYAEREGWTITERYKDEAISGAKKDRPGYQELLHDAEAKDFQVLLVDDLSRLSRDDVEMKQVIRRLKFWAIRIIGVSDGFDSESKGYKIQAGVRGLMNEIYLDDIRDKTHRGLTGQAIKGNNCGGRSYGYTHIPIEDPSQQDQYGRPRVVAVKREIDSEQARWVKQMFQWYADGHSPRWIANELNKRGVPSPRGGKWAASAIYGHMTKGTGILNNPLYVGKYVWNRSEWVRNPDTGKRHRVERPETDWIVSEMPELRILPEALWDRVKARQSAQYRKSEAIREALHANARTGRGPKYLFSGLLKCAECGANYVMVSHYHYGCATQRNRGPSACSNSLKVSRKLVEERLLEGIKRDLFTPEAIELFRKETAQLLAEKKRHPSLAAGKRRLADIEAQIQNIVKAIQAGAFSPALQAALEKAEADKARTERELKLDTGFTKIPDILPRAVDRYRALVADLENVTQRHVAQARTHIKALVGDVRLFPKKGYLEAEMAGDYAGLLQLASASQLNVVAGAGFEPTTFGL